MRGLGDLQLDGVFARERQEQIAQIVEERGRARVVELAARFGVSAVTIRKDLLTLEQERRVTRTHGGAVVRRERPELAFDVRETLQSDEKRRIAIAAAELVSDGESLAFDASTSALYLARQLKSRTWHQLTIITNGIRIASELAGQRGITVLMPGGRVRWEALSLIGPLGSSVYRKINIQKAMVGAAGFTVESGLSDAIEEEVQIKRAMVGAAREVVALVDHTKWGRTSSVTFCRTDRIRTVMTDDAAPMDMVEDLRRLGIDVHLVDAGPTQANASSVGSASAADAATPAAGR